MLCLSEALDIPLWVAVAVDKTRLQRTVSSRLLIVYKGTENPPESAMATFTAAPARPIRRLIGYARVSTEDQATDAQVDELRSAGCQTIHEEHGRGRRGPGLCSPA